MSALTQRTYGRVFLIAIVAAIVGTLMFVALSPAGAAIVDPHKKTRVYGDACDALGFDTKSFSFTIPHGDDDGDDDDSRVFDRTFSLEDGASLFVSVASNRKTMSFELTDATADGVVIFKSYSQGTANVYDYRGVEPPVTSDDDLKAYKGRSIKTVALCYTTKASPTLTIDATASAVVGDPISAVASLTGGDNASGSLSINLYSDSSCTVPEAGPFGHTVNGDGNFGSDDVYADAGTFYWQAVYEGDGNNFATQTDCGAGGEVSEVAKATPTISTTATPSATVGDPISAVATLGGGHDLGEYVTFFVYNDDSCTTPIAELGPIAVTGTGEYPSGNYNTDAAGTHYWVATYSGDPNNNGVSDECGEGSDVSSEVAMANPTVSTEATTDVILLEPISATATLLGAFDPEGTVTFQLFGDDECTLPALETLGPMDVDENGMAESGDFTPTEAGSYFWRASYSGDDNNSQTDGTCGDSESIIYAATVACLEGDSVLGLPGEIANEASFVRGEIEGGKDSCEDDIPYTLDVELEHVTLGFPINADYPGARFLVKIDWNPADSDNTIDPLDPPVRDVDYFVNGTFVPGLPCLNTNAPDGATPSVMYEYEHPTTAEYPDGVPVCLAGYDIRPVEGGGWQQIQWWDVIGDPRWA